MNVLKTLFASMVIMSSAAAVAETATFADLDADKDGVISKIEASASESLMKVFNELDSNQDGELSEDEFNK
ncbi:calmodulin [Pseudoalteromonas sp. T1lg23B]|uniref:calmodulin n=1 Tax=Pseudoalteromonas sp. T1lg23B TaxID=2077097 RepID=UPI000CF69494|nr:calmodulin [Pseudoalteromonas sp. T1lg23B]